MSSVVCPACGAAFPPPAVERHLCAKEVVVRIDVSPRTLWRMVSQGRFPAPLRFSRKTVRWRESDVAAWLEGRWHGEV